MYLFKSFFSRVSLPLLSAIAISNASPLPKDSSSVISVGFDLAVDFGTASVQLHNGSFYDAIVIDGEGDYKIMMRRLVDLATNHIRTTSAQRSHSLNASLKAEKTATHPSFNPQKEHQNPIFAGARNLQASKWRIDVDDRPCARSGTITEASCSSNHLDQCHCDPGALTDINTLSTMIADLRSAVESHLSVQLKAVAVSIPTITKLQPSTVNAALKNAGLSNMHPNNLILSAASAALISADITTPSPSNILILEYQPFALITTLSPHNPRSSTSPVLDEAAGSIARDSHKFSSGFGYWQHVQAAISQLPKSFPDKPIDTVVVAGKYADKEDFMQNMQMAILLRFPRASLKRPELLIRQPLFSAARGAARFAEMASHKAERGDKDS